MAVTATAIDIFDFLFTGLVDPIMILRELEKTLREGTFSRKNSVSRKSISFSAIPTFLIVLTGRCSG
jgi:hypothetical protein